MQANKCTETNFSAVDDESTSVANLECNFSAAQIDTEPSVVADCEIVAQFPNETLHETETTKSKNNVKGDIQTDNLMAELQRRTSEAMYWRSVADELSLKQNGFINNDKKVKFYTGLSNYKLLCVILNRIDGCLSTIVVRNLDNFQKLLLTLMKLRSNFTFSDLAYRFRVDNRAASRIFKKVIFILHYTFENLIHWPDREHLKMLMPKCFEDKFGDRVSVIIDCFEIATERPSTLKARNQSFSHYKQKHTAKYLIGITPQGTVSFISPGYGGRVSDKIITEDCGILEKLQEGDIVLADRGFTVGEILASREVQLLCPAFKGTNDQIEPKDVENSRSISAVRIHVERVIGEIRQKYEILNGPIPINLLNCKFNNISMLDCIVKVACVFINLCESVVPL